MRPYWLASVLIPDAEGAVTGCTWDCGAVAVLTGAGVRFSTGVSSSLTLDPQALSRPAITAAVPRVDRERTFIWQYLLVVEEKSAIPRQAMRHAAVGIDGG